MCSGLEHSAMQRVCLLPASPCASVMPALGHSILVPVRTHVECQVQHTPKSTDTRKIHAIIPTNTSEFDTQAWGLDVYKEHSRPTDTGSARRAPSSITTDPLHSTTHGTVWHRESHSIPQDPETIFLRHPTRWEHRTPETRHVYTYGTQ
eukprot:m.600851 g.600851  ORF g.600851 m.600851 type:complete len:149 (-) comp22435_c0_seq3:1703-2149(-)